MAMTDLLLQPGSMEYEVIADGQIVGRISLFSSSPADTPWMWSIDFAFHDDRAWTQGFAASHEAAMQAFARSWFQEASPALLP